MLHLNACTIIAKNYLAYARVLARSFTRHHPGGRFWTLIIDDFTGRIDPQHEPFEVLTPDEIGCEPFLHMAMRYTVLELSTAVKPWLLRHLMGITSAPITYLDPDIKVYSPLIRLDELAAADGLVLTPHNSSPIPPDDRRPSQVDIMIAGTYNLGYVSVAPGREVHSLLDWWSDRLLRDCRVDPRWGYFVDQRWFDLAPGFLTKLAIVREPQYNVAYWNLHSRHLEHDGERYLVDGRPLGFFHFSGFDPKHALALSRYQDRVDVLADPVLERILGEYATEVLDEGHERSRAWPYGYAALGDGTQLDDTVRALFDEFAAERNGGAPSPFRLEGAATFMHWLRQRPPGAPPGVNRVLARAYAQRADLRGAYPSLEGAGREGLLRWAHTYGQHEIPALARTMMASPGEADAADPTPGAPGAEAPARPSEAADPAPGQASSSLRDGPWGVNVVGYFRSELGMGEAARQVVAALDAKDIPVLPVHGQTIPLSRQGHVYETATPADAVFPVNLICMNADVLPEFAGQAGNEFFAGRYSVGLWFWEVSRFPERWRGSFSLLEEVWAPTDHVAAALEPIATRPVNTIRIPVLAPSISACSRAELGLPQDCFLFLFSFDYLSVFQRKNPLAVIEAFIGGFAAGEGAHLVIKCINHERDPSAHARLLDAARRHPDITVIDRYLSPGDNNSLTWLCDSYVSLHRAEGFGLVMAEAMAFAKPVIATGYSGNLDFMTADNSLLVDHRLVPIGTGAEPYPADGEWAEPDIAHASSLMRRLFDDPAEARAVGTRAAADIGRTHSPATAGDLLHRRLESIRATGRARRASDSVSSLGPALAGLPLRIRQGPVRGATRGRGGSARELARTAALRAMRPLAAYQHGINAELVAALEELHRELADLRLEAAADRARLLAELRSLRPPQSPGPSDALDKLQPEP